MTYGEAIKTPGTALYRMAQQSERERLARLKMTPEAQAAYWKRVCAPGFHRPVSS